MLNCFVDLARYDCGRLFDKRVGNHVGQRLELRAEGLEVPEVVDARNEDAVARADKRLDVPQVDLRRKAALVVR